jgi:putative addiction module component (TIGR02574 family)
MTPHVAELLKSALSLSPAEREELADGLWASLEPLDQYGALTEEQFTAELHRRAAELKADPAQGATWEDVQKVR